MGGDTNINRRTFLKTLGVGAVVTLVPFACSKQEERGAGAKSASSEGVVYTRENPGPWREKAEGHVPNATLTKLDEAGNYRVEVVVNHEMNPDKPHWISDISIKDEKDALLGNMSLLPTDPKAEASFEANAAHVAKFKVYSLCNLHGLWLNEYEIPA